MKPYYQDKYVTIYLGDCREVLPELPKVDLVLTDPPYGIGYKSGALNDMYGQPRKYAPAFGDDNPVNGWCRLCFDIMRENSFLYAFTRWDVLYKQKQDLEEAGLKVVQRLIWNKLTFKMGDLRYYGSQLEDILFCIKGKPKMNGKRSGNLFSQSAFYLPEGQYDHPTQKPERIISHFIVDTTKETSLILDPFLGSGTTIWCAKKLNRRCIGIEIEEKYCEIAAQRCSQMVMDFSSDEIGEEEPQSLFPTLSAHCPD